MWNVAFIFSNVFLLLIPEAVCQSCGSWRVHVFSAPGGWTPRCLRPWTSALSRPRPPQWYKYCRCKLMIWSAMNFFLGVSVGNIVNLLQTSNEYDYEGHQHGTFIFWQNENCRNGNTCLLNRAAAMQVWLAKNISSTLPGQQNIKFSLLTTKYVVDFFVAILTPQNGTNTHAHKKKKKNIPSTATMWGQMTKNTWQSKTGRPDDTPVRPKPCLRPLGLSGSRSIVMFCHGMCRAYAT